MAQSFSSSTPCATARPISSRPDFATLLKDWPAGPFKPLPGGAEFRVALRRSLRVGKRWGGQAIEDLGVIPDVRYEMTARDLLQGNADLMEEAGELLAQGTPRTLDITVTSQDSPAAALEVTRPRSPAPTSTSTAARPPQP